jgi:hypothetical protein
MEIENRLMYYIEYLSSMTIDHDLKNTWKPIADDLISLINTNIFTNKSFINFNLNAIPDAMIKNYILDRI